MAVIQKETLSVHVPALATCGWRMSQIRDLALALSKADEGEVWDIVPEGINPMERMTLCKLEAEATGGMITPESVVRRYALPAHTLDMDKDAHSGMPSTSFEIPVELRAVAHTGLYVVDGIYSNGKVSFPVKNLVPFGEQTGQIMAHLAGCFSTRCSKEFMKEICSAQAQDERFMAIARQVEARGGLDYATAPKLSAETKLAKEELGL